jgi:dihydrofolate synthase/folylpolyglutamate synthase
MESSTPFTGSAGVFSWLSRFINFERDLSHKPFRLDRMRRLAELAGRPESCAPAVHVAGSKGKGSVTGMIAAILEAGGYKTARYASPHVSDFRERISLGSSFFAEEIYAEAGNRLRRAAGDFMETGDEPTYFELMTLWFFLCARLSGCRAMAVETGMGGRLDATNIMDPLVSVITVIELEHTEILGNTIAAIAGEKAGIIKSKRPLVLAGQKPEALEVFRRRASETESPLFYFPQWGKISGLCVSPEGTAFNLELKDPQPGRNGNRPGSRIFRDLRLLLPGRIQAENAGLAVLAIAAAFPDIPEKAVREGLGGFSLPARFERLRTGPVFVIDGAHTARSAGECVRTFTELYGRGGVLLFGCASGKDVLSMAETLIPAFSRIIITTPGTFKKSAPVEVYDAFVKKASGHRNPPEILFIPHTGRAIEEAVSLGEKENLPVLGTGSFYLAGEIRRVLLP